MIQRPFCVYVNFNDTSLSFSCSSVSWYTWQTITLLILDELSHLSVLSQVPEATWRLQRKQGWPAAGLLMSPHESQTRVWSESVWLASSEKVTLTNCVSIKVYSKISKHKMTLGTTPLGVHTFKSVDILTLIRLICTLLKSNVLKFLYTDVQCFYIRTVL